MFLEKKKRVRVAWQDGKVKNPKFSISSDEINIGHLQSEKI